MTELVKIVDGLPMVTSKDIADKFDKPHRDVTKGIKSLDCSDEFRVRNFSQSSYLSSQNKKLKCVNMTKDGFAFLCMGFTGKKAAAWKEKYISAFNDMVETLTNDAPSTMKALNELTKKIEGDQELASKCGTLLAKYKSIKKDNQDNWAEGVQKVQMNLGFDSI
jgi:Rha family phage regulatory protein